LELVVRPDAHLIGLTATDIRLRVRYGINLIAISNQGQRSISRLRTTQFQASDVLLVQGESEALSGFASEFGCVPLAERSIRIPDRRQAIIAMLVMAAAVGGAAFGLLPAAISFAAGVIAYMALRVIPLRTVYDAIDWPVIVLLGALIPVAGAMATTGAADLLAQLLLQNIAQGNAIVALAMILVVTMTLSDFMNNAATAAVMAPISLSTAAQLSVNPDSFLMAVAIGASCAFLTPIGHQNNTLILGPGGFRFGDYWRLGLPLEIIVTAVSIPMLLIVWPL
jgi:di/tricarboxylate transporter